MSDHALTRRHFLASAAARSAALAWPGAAAAETLPGYRGPNVVIVRFGGGVRREEVLNPDQTYAPYFLQQLVPRGVFFPDVRIDQFSDIETSHGQGTLYILTGKYHRYEDVGGRLIGARFEAPVPTLFEYLRGTFAVAPHEAVIINGEDRTDEEFYNFSNHHLFGVQYRSTTISLFRFKQHILRRQLEAGIEEDESRAEAEKRLAEMEALDYRTGGRDLSSPEVEAFWDRWRERYGDSGLKCPRGDRLLTHLAVAAMNQLRPRLMMINYNDPDYVHWGNPAFYFDGIRIIDHALERLVAAVEADPFYAGNTVFVVMPDCGRDSNRMMHVPFQHHFGSRTSHEIFALVFGTGVPRGKVVDRAVNQTNIAATVGGLMGFEARYAEAGALEEVFA